MAADDEVVIGLTHGLDDPESVLLSDLMGVEALRKGKQVLLWLTKDGVHVATEGFCDHAEGIACSTTGACWSSTTAPRPTRLQDGAVLAHVVRLG